ncbi:MAG: dethiobiotin synthase [Pseudonocardia sp.]
MTVLVVTGTGTEVGKTVVTAALSALAVADGRRVSVLKPAQTGVADDESGDLDDVRRLVGPTAGLTTRELGRYPDPLSPATAAARCGRPAIGPDLIATAARESAKDHDLVLVEGAGGLLVRFAGTRTLADVAVALHAPVLVVTAAGLGTLNHTALTTEALTTRGLRCAGLVIGSWPVEPELAARCNLTDLPAVTGSPLRGRLPAGVGRLDPREFLATARAGIEPLPGWLG